MGHQKALRTFSEEGAIKGRGNHCFILRETRGLFQQPVCHNPPCDFTDHCFCLRTFPERREEAGEEGGGLKVQRNEQFQGESG